MPSSPRKLNFGNEPAQPTLTQIRALKAAKNNMNKANKEFKNYSRPRLYRISNENAKRYEQLENEVVRKRKIFRSIIRKVVPVYYYNFGHTNWIPQIIFEQGARKVIAKYANRGLEGARKHHLKWLQNMVNSGMSPNQISNAMQRKYMAPRYITKTPPRNSPRPRNPFHRNAVRQSESQAIARRQSQHGPATNRITWSRRPNGKINIHKTLSNLEFSLTNKQKKTLENMPENQAVSALRWFAREAQLR
jgi:RecG-like helicase